MISTIKSFLRETLALPPELVLVVAGLVSHVMLCLLLGRSPYAAWGLLGPLIFGVALEGYEIWVHYKDIGLFAPGNDSLLTILLRHGKDVLLMLSLPLLLVAMGR